MRPHERVFNPRPWLDNEGVRALLMSEVKSRCRAMAGRQIIAPPRLIRPFPSSLLQEFLRKR
jgi:hypothetical protein